IAKGMVMNRGFNQALGLLAGYCFALAVAATCWMQMAHGQDAVPPGPPVCPSGQCPTTEHSVADVNPAATQLLDRATRALTAEFGNGIIFRVTMPYPGQFFEKTCNGPTRCEEMVQRIGGGPEARDEERTSFFTTRFLRLGCPCVAAGECVCASHATCGVECVAAEASTSKYCPCAAESP